MIRHALRRLRRTPAFTALAVVSLACSLGVTTAIYSTLASVLWPPPLVASPDRLAIVTRQAQPGLTQWRSVISKSDFDVLQAQVKSVRELAAARLVASSLDDGSRTIALIAEATTGNFFSTLGLPIVHGRAIGPADDRPDSPFVVVLSRSFWETHLGGDPGWLGTTVRVRGRPFVIVGIAGGAAPSGLDPTGAMRLGGADAWISMAAASSIESRAVTREETPDHTVVARLAAGAALETVSAEFMAIGAGLDVTHPLAHDAGAEPRRRSWTASTVAAVERPSFLGGVPLGAAILSVVALVLVVACTNIGCLTLGRGASRLDELGVRRALGASRRRLMLEEFTESLVIAAAGGFGGLLTARWLCGLLAADIPMAGTRILPLRPTLDTGAFVTIAVGLVASVIVFGAAPAAYLTRAALRDRILGQPATDASVRWRGRQWLIALQVAISTSLLVMTWTTVRGVSDRARHDPGFDLSRLALTVIDFRPLGWEAGRVGSAVAALRAGVASDARHPDVAMTAGLPIGTGGLRRLGQAAADGRLTTVVGLASTPKIFTTLGVPLVRGRHFDDRDLASGAPVAVVSEHVARDLFGTVEAIGRTLRYRDAAEDQTHSLSIIGIARDTDTNQIFDRRIGAIYVPLSARGDTSLLTLVARRGENASDLLPTLGAIVRRADPDLAISYSGSAVTLLSPGTVVLGGVSAIAGGLSALAVTLAMLGLFGVLSHLVARRTREIGIRLALGAGPGRLRRMVVGDGLRPVVWGIAAGLFAGAVARAALRPVLHLDLPAVDTAGFAIAAAILLACAVAAAAIPARRASTLDPNVALRHS
jgi:predicted permease